MSEGAASLLPGNATPQEWALDLATARVGDVPVPLRSVWNPEQCPASLLPWLAWALSLDDWKSYWPETVKRQRIKTAVEVQRRKGTAKSVRDVVASFGASLALKEWWQAVPMAEPHTFSLVLTVGGDVPASSAYQQDIIDAVTRTKPVRSHFTFTAGVKAESGVALGAAVRPTVYARLATAESDHPPQPIITGPNLVTEAFAPVEVAASPNVTVEIIQIDQPSEPEFSGPDTVTGPSEPIALQAWPGATVEIEEV